MEEFAWNYEQSWTPESHEWWPKINESAVQKVQENARKAKQASITAKKNRQENQQFAVFLTYILQNINNEKIISNIYHVFFKTKNPKTNTTLLRKNINIIVITWLFAPFHLSQLQTYKLDSFFSKIYNYDTPITLHKYLEYLKKLSHAHHDNIPIDQWNFLTLLVEIIQHYQLVPPYTNQEEYQKLLQQLKQELFA